MGLGICLQANIGLYNTYNQFNIYNWDKILNIKNPLND